MTSLMMTYFKVQTLFRHNNAFIDLFILTHLSANLNAFARNTSSVTANVPLRHNVLKSIFCFELSNFNFESHTLSKQQSIAWFTIILLPTVRYLKR